MTEALLNSDASNSNTLAVTFSGDWLLGANLPGVDSVLEQLRHQPGLATVSFNTGGLGDWDTGLITTLLAIHRNAMDRDIEFDNTGLPDGARRLLTLAFAVKEREGARRHVKHKRFFERVGDSVLEAWDNSRQLLAFTGELVLSFGRFFRGSATYLRSDLLQYIQEAGAQAFPIVSLISFLIGMIFAFVGVMQLNLFGAGIYTANLVAVAMVREMAPI